MKLLLPHRFKKVGAVIAPLGFTLWLLMQKGITKQFLIWLFGESNTSDNLPPYHTANVVIAAISFFSFLGGLYLLSFSKEKVEDEMIQRTRLDSFQFAAVIQIIVIILGFLTILLWKDPGEGGLMLFFIAVVVVFWICFIARFNYVLHVKLK